MSDQRRGAIESIHRLLDRLRGEPAGDLRRVFSRTIRPAFVSTSRCFMIAGSEIGNGCGQLAHRQAVPIAEPREQGTPRRIGQRRKGAVDASS